MALDFSKSLNDVIIQRQIPNIVAGVGFALDVSGSMTHLFENQVCQRLIEQLFAVALKFDDDGILDMWTFSDKCVKHPPVTATNHTDYIKKEITTDKHSHLWYATSYAPCLQSVFMNSETKPFLGLFGKKKVAPQRRIVFFLTDGCMDDYDSTVEVLRKYKDYPVFVQFIDISASDSLNKLLMQMTDEFDNTSTVAVSYDANPEDLYNAILSEKLVAWWKKGE